MVVSLIVACLSLNLVAMEHPILFSDVISLNNDLYVGNVADGLYLGMERIGPDNIEKWLEYAAVQKEIGDILGPDYIPSTVGSDYFLRVLRSWRDGTIARDNELWVAYASNRPITGRADFTGSYDYVGARRRFHASVCNPSIEMFVTVVTSPDALITSHMGISRTWESALRLHEERSSAGGKKRGLAIPLHSFAAKIMLLRNPGRRYMLTAPVAVMREMLLKAMPDSVFIGDNLYQKQVEDITRGATILVDGSGGWDSDSCAEKFSQLRTNPPRIIRPNEHEFIIKSLDGTQDLCAFNRSTRKYQWLFTESYENGGVCHPHVLFDLNALAGWKMK